MSSPGGSERVRRAYADPSGAHSAQQDHPARRRCPGVTSLVDRPTRAAAELTAEELRLGAIALDALVRRYRPRVLAVLGITAYRTGFARPRAVQGLQEESIGGAVTWVVPNPSGLNAYHQLPDLARIYGRLRTAVGRRRADIGGAG